MSNDPFAQDQDPFASAGEDYDSITTKRLCGSLFLLTPLDHVFGVKTQFSTPEKPTQDVIDTAVVILDGPDAGKEFESVRIFQGPLIGRLKAQAKFNAAHPAGDPRTGKPKMFLARTGRGEDKSKRLTPQLEFTDADKRAWLFLAPSEEDKQTARDYLAKLPVAEPADPFAM